MTLIWWKSERMGDEFFWETTVHHSNGGEIGLTQTWYEGDKLASRHSVVLMAEELKEILTQAEKTDTMK